MNHTVQIFVEGTSDQVLISRLLDDLQESPDLKYVLASGRDAMRPLVRRALLTQQTPVVMLLDADTTDERQAKERLRELNDYLSWGNANIPFKVIQFVPEIEVLFFDIPAALESLLCKRLSPEMLIAGKAAPKQLLSAVTAGKSTLEVIGQLRREDWVELRHHPCIAELRSFLLATNTAEARR